MSQTPKKALTGLHIVGQIKTQAGDKCRSDAAFKAFVSSLIRSCKLEELGSFYYSFGGSGGFTGVVCLSESHIAVHTWPELEYVTLDVFLCNYSRNNEETCREAFSKICVYFEAVSVSKQEVFR